MRVANNLILIPDEAREFLNELTQDYNIGYISRNLGMTRGHTARLVRGYTAYCRKSTLQNIMSWKKTKET